MPRPTLTISAPLVHRACSAPKPRSPTIARGAQKTASVCCSAKRTGPKNLVLAGLIVILAGVCLVPVFIFGAAFVAGVEEMFGGFIGAPVGAVVMALAAFAVYHAPAFFRSFASPFRGGFGFRRRGVETPWATLFILILLPAVILIAFQRKRSTGLGPGHLALIGLGSSAVPAVASERAVL